MAAARTEKFKDKAYASEAAFLQKAFRRTQTLLQNNPSAPLSFSEKRKKRRFSQLIREKRLL